MSPRRPATLDCIRIEPLLGKGGDQLFRTELLGALCQVCGIYAGPRVDEIPENVFHTSSRINSTWGGNLVDMVRCKRFIDIIEAENLGDNIAKVGDTFVRGLREIAKERGHFTNVRGCGSLVAFTLQTHELRNEMLSALFDKQVMALPSGERAIRFRLPLVMTEAEAGEALTRIAECTPAKV